MHILAVIPARYASTRLPGKPLLDICGKPMICQVYAKVKAASAINEVIVATDDERIKAAVEKEGGVACLTSKDCASGSDRLLEVAKTHKADIYLNVQGDEPLIDPGALNHLASFMKTFGVGVATLAFKIDAKRARDPNLVKVVCDYKQQALYFSRSVIPYDRDNTKSEEYLAHLGVYAYNRLALETFGRLPPSPLEQMEKLEQLRLLQAQIPIHVILTESHGPGVDTFEDLEIVRKIMSGQPVEEESLTTKLSRIRLIVTDVDGVLTTGCLYYGDEGEVLKGFNVKDGLGVALAKKQGLQIAVLSGRDSKPLRRRLSDLGISLMRLGRLKKGQDLPEILAEANCSPTETLFLGDDVMDLEGFAGCSLGVAVANAHPQVLAKADLVLKSRGGEGALREIIDLVLNAK